MAVYQKLHIIDHPLVQHKLSLIRNEETGVKEFRELLEEIAMLMTYEVTRSLPLKEIEIRTPVARCKTKVISGRKLGIIPILRAGLGMVEGIMRLVPTAKVGHLGMYRDPKSLEPIEYYAKLPSDVSERELIVLDPMLATGRTACSAIAYLKGKGCTSIKLVSLIISPEAAGRITDEHPDVDIYAAAMDERLDEHGYIVPGLGDAGDRIFGTR